MYKRQEHHVVYYNSAMVFVFEHLVVYYDSVSVFEHLVVYYDSAMANTVSIPSQQGCSR